MSDQWRYQYAKRHCSDEGEVLEKEGWELRPCNVYGAKWEVFNDERMYLFTDLQDAIDCLNDKTDE